MPLTGAIQEGLLAVLCFDQEKGPIVKSTIDPNYFDIYYRPIVRRAHEYWEQYQVPPNEHLIDIIEELSHEQPKNADVLHRIYDSLMQTRESLNPDYLLDRATTFVRQQRLKDGIMRAVEFVQEGNLDEAEGVLNQSMIGVHALFDPGVKLTDVDRSLAFLTEQVDAFPTGILALDRRGLGPTRKELHLFMAPPKRGKTWWLVHLGKHALMHHKRVVHITLEMSESKTCQRYIQTLFSVSKRKEDHIRIAFEEDDTGRLTGFKQVKVPKRPAFTDRKIRQVILDRLDRAMSPFSLVVKQFPTGGLTMGALAAYLDTLEAAQRFIPDLLLLDYVDLMDIDPATYRLSLGALYKELRGLAVKRNIAIATASQVNRAGAKARLVTDIHAGEDYSKVATSDTVITYNQTDDERALGLARLFVAAGRSDEDRFLILISQRYALGQFCMASTRMASKYWDMVAEADEEETE